LRKSPLKRALGVGLVVGAAATTLFSAAPANAASTHPGVVITAAGSDTTEGMMDQILTDNNPTTGTEFNIHAQPLTNFTVPGDNFCTSATYNDIAAGTVFDAPQGSGAGRNALKNSVGATFPDAVHNTGSPSGTGKGCVDIARSSAEPQAIGTDLATFEYYGFALDDVTWASPSLQAPAALTVQQVRDIFNCVTTNWSQIPGGGNGPIQRVFPSTSSGTGDTFIKKVLGGVAPPSGVAGCPNVITAEENHGNLFLDTTNQPALAAAYQQAILPYSAGKWAFQVNNSANPTLDIRGGVRIGGIIPTAGTQTSVKYPLNWNGVSGKFRIDSAATLVNESNPNLGNPNDTTQLPGVRYLYNVIDSTSPSYTVARDIVGFDRTVAATPAAPLCNGGKASTIVAQGFLNLPAQTVGSATNSTCRFNTP
jgi:ABC-type phosphate transport system substrate-binding protein